MVRQQGPGAYEALVPQLLAAAGGAAALAEVACLVLQFVSEDLTQYEETVAGEARRQFLSALLASTPSVLPFICQVGWLHWVHDPLVTWLRTCCLALRSTPCSTGCQHTTPR